MQWNTVASGNTYVSVTPGATAAPTIGVGGTSSGLILNAGTGALTLETTGSNAAVNITPNGTEPVYSTSGVTTGTGATAGFQEVYNSLTTGNGEDVFRPPLPAQILRPDNAMTTTNGTVLNILATSGAIGSHLSRPLQEDCQHTFWSKCDQCWLVGERREWRK